MPVADTLSYPCWLDTALNYVGVTEATGHNDGPQVALFLKSVKLGEGPPWCGAFPHHCYRRCDIVLRPERSYARAAFWHEPPHRLADTATILPGDHFALYYNELGRIGHEGFVEGRRGKYILTVEGNTNAAGSREGQGVWKRRRLLRTIHCFSRHP